MQESELDKELGIEKPKRKYGEPGSLMKSSDGKIYEVQPDGSWRRYQGGVSDPVGQSQSHG